MWTKDGTGQHRCLLWFPMYTPFQDWGLWPFWLHFLSPTFFFKVGKNGKKTKQAHTEIQRKRVKWKQRKSYLMQELHNLKAVSIVFPCKLFIGMREMWSGKKLHEWSTTQQNLQWEKNNAPVSLKSQACIGDTANTNSTCRKYGTHQILIQMVPDTSTRSQQKAVDSRTV